MAENRRGGFPKKIRIVLVKEGKWVLDRQYLTVGNDSERERGKVEIKKEGSLETLLNRQGRRR